MTTDCRRASSIYPRPSGVKSPFLLPLIPLNEGLGLIGTATFASINAHLGLELGRWDGLESLAYILFYFLWGSLPWQGAAEEQDILEGKRGITGHDLFHKLPVEFCMFFEHCRTLSFDGRPDYDHYYNLFDALLFREGPRSDMAFNWVNAGSEIRKRQNGSRAQNRTHSPKPRTG